MQNNKDVILTQLLARVQKDLSDATTAAQAATDGAQDESMKSDGKYDTRGIEAGYLAGAQMRRVEELKQEVELLEEMPRKDFTDADDVGLGALVDIKFKGQVRTYFMCSMAGGTLLELNGKAILVISVFSPIGNAALGLKVNDSFEIETPNEKRDYTIVGIA